MQSDGHERVSKNEAQSFGQVALPGEFGGCPEAEISVLEAGPEYLAQVRHPHDPVILATADQQAEVFLMRIPAQVVAEGLSGLRWIYPGPMQAAAGTDDSDDFLGVSRSRTP